MALFRLSPSALQPNTVLASVTRDVAFASPGFVDSGESMASPTSARQSFGSRR